MSLAKLKIESQIEQTEISGAEIHQKAKTNLHDRVESPPIAISIGRDDKEYMGEFRPLVFGTLGNISLIKGEEKVRKSFLKSLVLACAIGGKADRYSENIRGHIGEKWIVDIDSEQDPYYAWLNAARIPNMVGVIPKNYMNIQLRTFTVAQRREYLKWLFTESPFKDNLGVVFIDGYVDFVKDFNNLEQCQEFVHELMAYSADSRCHISGILHLNYNSEKGRGHLGTILQQKCETVAIVKDAGEHSTFECQRGRGKKFPSFEFGVDEKWMPYEVGVLTKDDILL